MTVSHLDVDRLRTALTYLTQNPENHDQTVWGFRVLQPAHSCGTAFCLAGTICSQEEGAELKWMNDFVDSQGRQCQSLVGVKLPGSKIFGWPRYAAEKLLGISVDEGEELFMSWNTMADLWIIAERITKGDIKAREYEDIVT